MYSTLNIEDITDAGYMHAKRVCYTIKIKNVGEYHDLYLKSYILLLTYVFKNFRKMCLKIYHLDPEKFLSALGLAWQVVLKKSKVKLELLTNINRLLMVEKIIWGGNVALFIDMPNLTTGKIMIKIKNRHIFNIWM